MSAHETGTGLPPNTPNGTDATADAPGTVESAAPGQDVDADLIADDDLDEGNS